MKLKNMLPLFALMLLASCGEKKEMHIPVQAEQEGRWGMVTTDGEVVFEGKFENEPCIAHNERFLVQNKEELYEFFTVEKEPRKIGTTYRTAMDFINEVTAVAEPDSIIKLIDKEGEVVLRLDQINGKDVERIPEACDGAFLYVDETEAYGCIDTEGKVLIPAEYEFLSFLGDGYVLGKPKTVLPEGERRNPYWIMNLQGEKLGEVNMMKYDGSGFELIDGKYLQVHHYEGDEPRYGLIALDGTEKIPLTASISGIQGGCKDMFVFSKGELFGVMNVEGKELIPAKYKNLYFMSADRLMAFDEEGKGKIIDVEDKQIGTYGNYAHLYPEAKYYGDKAVVPLTDTEWVFIDKEGKEAGEKHWYRVGGQCSQVSVENDYCDPKELFEWLKVTANGVDGLTFSSTSEEVQARETDIFYDNIGKNTGFRKTYRNRDIWVNIYMSGNLKARRGGVWKHTNATPICFEVSFTDDRIDMTSCWMAALEMLEKLGKKRIDVRAPFEAYQVDEDICAVAKRNAESVDFYLCKASALKRVLEDDLYEE